MDGRCVSVSASGSPDYQLLAAGFCPSICTPLTLRGSGAHYWLSEAQKLFRQWDPTVPPSFLFRQTVWSRLHFSPWPRGRPANQQHPLSIMPFLSLLLMVCLIKGGLSHPSHSYKKKHLFRFLLFQGTSCLLMLNRKDLDKAFHAGVVVL